MLSVVWQPRPRKVQQICDYHLLCTTSLLFSSYASMLPYSDSCLTSVLVTPIRESIGERIFGFLTSYISDAGKVACWFSISLIWVSFVSFFFYPPLHFFRVGPARARNADKLTPASIRRSFDILFALRFRSPCQVHSLYTRV